MIGRAESSTEYYFHWREDTRVVYGATGAAIYDLDIGNVYSLNEPARRVVEQIVNTQSFLGMSQQGRAFIDKLVELGIGYYDSTSQSPGPNMDVVPIVPLSFLWVELTGSCNLGCQHCYADSGSHLRVSEPVQLWTESEEIPLHKSPATLNSARAVQALTQAQWIEIIEDAAAQGCRQIQFIGGEPLLYPELLELIDVADSVGYTHIEVYTNGTMLNEKIVQAFAEYEVKIAVSLHGAKAKTQEQISQMPNSFERIIAGLALLQKYEVKTRLSTTVMRLNQHELDEIKQLAEQYGIANTSYDIVRDTGRGKAVEPPTELEVYESKWLSKPEFRTSHESFIRNHWWNTCWAGRLAVTNSGDVIPCVFGRNQVVGNVLESSLAEVLASEPLQKLWGLTKDQVGVCQDCEYRYACNDCRPAAASGITSSGDLLYAKTSNCTYDPYTGHWRPIEQDLGWSELRDTAVHSVSENTIPSITLVTDQSIAPERWQKFACEPSGPSNPLVINQDFAVW